MRILLIIALLLIASAGVFYGLMRASLPDYHNDRQLAGLEAAVDVAHDAYGVPTIRAQSAIDAYRALGFLHARDRLWQMEFARRAAQGRLSEILGGLTLRSDRFMRTLGLYRAAEKSMDNLEPETVRLLEAYSDGVNAYLQDSRVLPPEFWLLWHRPEPWRPADSVVWTKLMAFDLAANWRTEYLRARIAARLGKDILEELWPPVSDEVPSTLASTLKGGDLAGIGVANDRIAGSNAWAVSGQSRNATGALLASDPHLAMRIPSLWYLVRIDTPDLQFTGATIAGMPVPVLGRTRHVAWGFTNTGSDQQDLLIFDLADPSGEHYRSTTSVERFQVRQERIKVRFGTDRTINVRSTSRGPVLSDVLKTSGEFVDEKQVLSLAWPALQDGDTTIQAGFKIAKATDVSSFLEALGDFKAPQQNVIFATDQGDIGFVVAGWVPVRTAGSGWRPGDGDDHGADWQGMIPFADLPRSINPKIGYLFNANNHPVDRSYPFDLGKDWDSGMRARRLDTLLSAGPPKHPTRAQIVQLDQYSTLARDFLPHLLAAIEPVPAFGREALLLRQWDGFAHEDSAAMLLFAAWYDQLGALLYGDELGQLYRSFRGTRSSFVRSILDRRQHWCDDVRTLGREDCTRQIRLAFERALGILHQTYGDNPAHWRWGDAHRFKPTHLPFSDLPLIGRLFAIDLPIGGDSSSLNVAHYNVTPAFGFDVHQGPGFRGIYDLNDPKHALLSIAGGQSGHPLSRHYDDFSELWRRGGYLEITSNDGECCQATIRLHPSQSRISEVKGNSGEEHFGPNHK